LEVTSVVGGRRVKITSKAQIAALILAQVLRSAKEKTSKLRIGGWVRKTRYIPMVKKVNPNNRPHCTIFCKKAIKGGAITISVNIIRDKR
jgi:hypothetical protein